MEQTSAKDELLYTWQWASKDRWGQHVRFSLKLLTHHVVLQCNSRIWVHASRYIFRSLSCRIRISCYAFPLNGETKDPKCFPPPSPSFSALRKTKVAPLPYNTSCWNMQWRVELCLLCPALLLIWKARRLGCALGASSLINQLEKQSASTGWALCLALIKVLWDHLFKINNLRFFNYETTWS